MTFTRFTYDCLSGRITSDKALTCREEKLGETERKGAYTAQGQAAGKGRGQGWISLT